MSRADRAAGAAGRILLAVVLLILAAVWVLLVLGQA
jgi:hypothetical protein